MVLWLCTSATDRVFFAEPGHECPFKAYEPFYVAGPAGPDLIFLRNTGYGIGRAAPTALYDMDSVWRHSRLLAVLRSEPGKPVQCKAIARSVEILYGRYERLSV